MNKKILFVILGITILIIISAILLFNGANKKTEIYNPATIYCLEQNGKHQIKSISSGEYGVCVFKDNSECEEWKFYNGECNQGEHRIDPDRVCTQEYNPVCGVNGVTYSNECFAGFVEIEYLGECNTNYEITFCTEEYDPVCGVDGITYSNECFANQKKIIVDYKGECKENINNQLIDVCTMEYDPVCGVDGITYSNECFAMKENITIDYQGECIFQENLERIITNNCLNLEGKLETRSSDDKEYFVCIFEDRSECEVNLLFLDDCQKGEYIVDSDKMCTMEYDPVCAVNGVTYSNPCIAGDIPIAYKGKC